MATEGYLRVISGAGSGKTKLLASRYAYLVSIPWIMCCTEIYVTREEAVDAAFEALEAVRAHGHYYK